MTTAPAVPEPVVVLVDDSPPAAPTVELAGQRFPLSDHPVPLLSLMKLATIAKRQREQEAAGEKPDADDSQETMVILYELVRTLIVDEAWPAFERHANRVGAGMDELQGLIEQATAARAARPTQPPSGSPHGQSTTAPSSAVGSSSPGSSIRQGDERVQHDLEARGRPDLALVVQRAREASTSS